MNSMNIISGDKITFRGKASSFTENTLLIYFFYSCLKTKKKTTTSDCHTFKQGNQIRTIRTKIQIDFCSFVPLYESGTYRWYSYKLLGWENFGLNKNWR